MVPGGRGKGSTHSTGGAGEEDMSNISFAQTGMPDTYLKEDWEKGIHTEPHSR